MESALCPADLIRNDPDFQLIETFGHVPGQGAARLSLHLARLQRSADAFGLAFDQAEIRQRLQDRHGDTPQRVRVTLSINGSVEVTFAPMPDAARVWTFAIAPERLNSEDPFLRYKTTRRALYDDARQNLPQGIDEWVFLNERDEVCEGTITNISITTETGARLTPPTSSGCLPGVYRQSCLNKGLVREAVLTLSDLHAAASINLTNSLRGSIQARWDPACAVLQTM